MQAPLVAATPQNREHEFRFLNVAKAFSHGKVDWTSTDMTRLWRYNLHYFDYILDTGQSVETLSDLISDWIKCNPVRAGEGWEPYTVSLRIVNWIKLFLRRDFRDSVEAVWVESLYQQALWLERNIEFHILANHYLKNGKALFYAGIFFEGADADRWLGKGLTILVEQAHEQILRDGGHFERSPMYHSIVIEDYLDTLNLTAGCPGSVPLREIDLLRGKATQALNFLHDICLPMETFHCSTIPRWVSRHLLRHWRNTQGGFLAMSGQAVGKACTYRYTMPAGISLSVTWTTCWWWIAARWGRNTSPATLTVTH